MLADGRKLDQPTNQSESDILINVKSINTITLLTSIYVRCKKKLWEVVEQRLKLKLVSVITPLPTAVDRLTVHNTSGAATIERGTANAVPLLKVARQP